MKSILQILCALIIIGIVELTSSFTAAWGATMSTTVYVGRDFEIREHDQPVKYVFNGANRIARITGSLAQASRIQQFRLYQGWNLISLAVSATNVVQQFSNSSGGALEAAYLWNPSSKIFELLTGTQSLTAGSILWLKASSDGIAKLFGSYSDPVGLNVKPEGEFLPSMGLEKWSFTGAGSGTVWERNGATRVWLPTFDNTLASSSQTAPVVAPGEAVFIETGQSLLLSPPDPALRIAWYHQDHLGSATITTDANGAIIDERAYFPFGAERTRSTARDLDVSYGFVQKELDDESHLQFFGHRYLAPSLGKWISADPLGERGGGPNPYAYADGNPLKLSDTDGSEIEITEKTQGNTTTYHIKLKAVLIDVSSKKFTQKQLAAYSAKLKAQIESSFKGKGKDAVEASPHKWKLRNFVWDTSVDLKVVSDWSQVEKEDHVFRIMDQTPDTAAGDTHRGAMLMNIEANVLNQPARDQWDKVPGPGPGLTWADYHSPEAVGAHEFGHAAGLPHQNTKQNLMTEGEHQRYENVKIDVTQIRKIVDAYKNKQINQRDEVLESLTKKK